jgi:hypothetical protein
MSALCQKRTRALQQNLSGPGLLCIRPCESSAHQALGRLGCVQIKNSGIALAFPGNRRFIGRGRPLERPFFWRCFGALSQARRHNSGREEVFSNVLEQ